MDTKVTVTQKTLTPEELRAYGVDPAIIAQLTPPDPKARLDAAIAAVDAARAELDTFEKQGAALSSIETRAVTLEKERAGIAVRLAEIQNAEDELRQEVRAARQIDPGRRAALAERVEAALADLDAASLAASAEVNTLIGPGQDSAAVPPPNSGASAPSGADATAPPAPASGASPAPSGGIPTAAPAAAPAAGGPPAGSSSVF